MNFKRGYAALKSIYSLVRFAFFVILVGIGVMTVGCGDDKPVGPITPKEQVVYFANQDPPYEFYCYHISSGKLDTFYVSYDNSNARRAMAISPDGRWMYLSSGSSIAIIDLRTRHVKREFQAPSTQEIAISPDGALLALGNTGDTHKGLWVLDATDGNIIFQDSLKSFNAIFSADSHRLYCAAFDTLGRIFAYTLDLKRHFETTRKYFSDGFAWRILPNRAENLWGIFLWIFNDLFLFEIYDPKADSVLYSQSMIPGFGDMVLSKDEKYLIYSQPGRLNSDVPIPDYFTIFNMENFQVERQEHFVVNDSMHLYIRELFLTADGKHLIGLAREMGAFFDYNMETTQFERLIYIGNTQLLVGLTGAGKP